MVNVTPFVGVWIETVNTWELFTFTMSHPSWVCGLKHRPICHDSLALAVTPFVGVWIETKPYEHLSENEIVTPFVGVWIETPKV